MAQSQLILTMTLIWKFNLPLTMKQLKEKSKTGENGFHYARIL